jgi:hypothetical protein
LRNAVEAYEERPMAKYAAYVIVGLAVLAAAIVAYAGITPP